MKVLINHETHTECQVICVILAGGQAIRMEGKNKALQQYKGKPLYYYVYEAIKGMQLPVKINVNKDHDMFESNQMDTFSDHLCFTDCGPLSGIATGLSMHQEECSHILFSPCDTPLVSSAVFEQLLKASKKEPLTTFYIETSSGVQPLHVIMPVAVLGCLMNFLKNKQYKVMRFYKEIAAKSILWEDETLFKNINYLDELT